MNGTEDIARQDRFTVGETVFYLSNGAIGAIFNCIVLWIAFVHIDTDDKPRQIIVINMTFADLIMCLCYMLTRPYLNFFPRALCHPYYITIWTIQLVSCLNLVWLNVDKLIFIQFPLHYYSIINRKKLYVVSLVTWIVLGYIAFAVDSFMTISKLFHRLFFLFSSTLWTFFTCLPYRILYLLFMLCEPCRIEVVHQMTDTFFRILVVGMVINPLITIWTQRIYRMHLLKFFNKWQDTREDTETSARRHSTKWNNTVESTPLTTAL
ncbi:hypothetical protein Q1695_000329 [Nippostrongylus brasiliensis]|nr:hypothetical protein Q1695_000329 [Nippostrongylus brasiliensis]